MAVGANQFHGEEQRTNPPQQYSNLRGIFVHSQCSDGGVVINLDGPDLLQSAPNCFHANLLFVALWFMLFKSFWSLEHYEPETLWAMERYIVDKSRSKSILSLFLVKGSSGLLSQALYGSIGTAKPQMRQLCQCQKCQSQIWVSPGGAGAGIGFAGARAEPNCASVTADGTSGRYELESDTIQSPLELLHPSRASSPLVRLWNCPRKSSESPISKNSHPVTCCDQSISISGLDISNTNEVPTWYTHSSTNPRILRLSVLGSIGAVLLCAWESSKVALFARRDPCGTTLTVWFGLFFQVRFLKLLFLSIHLGISS